jgi:glycosyltransferase involved in cell wall biosynthesis
MRIGVNLIPLRPGQMGGAEVYFRDLLAELLERGDHEYVLVTADYNHGSLPADSAHCRRVLFARVGGATAGRRWIVRLFSLLGWGLHWLADRYRGSIVRLFGLLGWGLRWLGHLYRRHVPAPVRALLRPMIRSIPRALELGLGWLRGPHRRHRAESLRELIRHERLDLWFCPFTNLEPRPCPIPAVITVHDIQHEYYPEFFHPDELRHRRQFYPESCVAADHIIAVSESTRRTVLEKYAVEPDAVSTIWEAAGSDFDWRGAGALMPIVRHKYGLPARYVLYPANTWHHKNHQRLIEALARYRDLYGETPTLVLTGVGKEGQARLEAAVVKYGLGGLVRTLGYVARDELPTLYAGAGCLVLPSLFEGFGIPLVEAMLAGCPIAAANVTSIPEIVGDAGVLFDPLDPADICRALGAILRDPGRAAELRRRGRARAELFSASRTAALTVELFERVVRDGLTRCRRAGGEMISVEGVYDDGWIDGEAVLALAGRALVSIEIEGHLPGLGLLLPQELAVQVRGQQAHVAVLTAPGPFSVSVPLSADGAGSGAWDVSLTPSRTFCPMVHGLSADSRDLSVQLLRVRARTHDSREIIKVFGLPAVGREG